MEHKIKDIVMGCLFISGEEGVTPVELRRIVNMDADGVRDVLKEIKKELKSEKKYMQLVEWGGRFKLTTLPDHNKYYEILAVEKLRTPLRPNLMETLAVIAYNQPCTRRKVDDIRGTNNNINIDRLIEKGLVEEIGRDSSPGNPFLYEVTKKFYDLFGIKTLSDLPKPNDFAVDATEDEVFEFTKRLKQEEIENQILEDQENKQKELELLKSLEEKLEAEAIDEELPNILKPELLVEESEDTIEDSDEYEDEDEDEEIDYLESNIYNSGKTNELQLDNVESNNNTPSNYQEEYEEETLEITEILEENIHSFRKTDTTILEDLLDEEDDEEDIFLDIDEE